MKTAKNNYLIVEFESNRILKYGKLELIRPISWEHKASDSEEEITKRAESLDRKLVNEQVAIVKVGNEKYPYKKGDRVFLHYMAKESEKVVEIDGEEYSAVDGDFVFFVINSDETFTMADNVYLGEQLYSDAPRTPSGIFTTPFDKVKEVLKIRITHAPQRIFNRHWDASLPKDRPFRYREPENKIGDIVATCDDFQYVLLYDGKEYIKLLDDEIVLKFEEDETT